jgi:hypothetical protein
MRIGHILALLLAVLLAGCGGAAGAPDRPAEIEGTITRVTADGRAQTILVEERPEEQSGSQKASVTLRSDTRVSRLSRAGVTTAGVSELRVGQRVRVWFTGPIRESYPVQVSAEAVVILDFR